MSEVLLIVDMQSSYVASQREDLRFGVGREASEVVARGGKVLAINFDGGGTSTVSLPDAETIWKDRNEGGNEVYAWLVGAGLVSRDLRVRVCGVNLCACVYQTAQTLAWRLYEEHGYRDAVSIVVSLCGDEAKYRIGFEVS